MIADILSKAEKEKTLTKEQTLQLFKPANDEEFTQLIETAFNITRDTNKFIKLTSTIHITNLCHITPKCKYCGFAAGTSAAGYYRPFSKTNEEILESAKIIEESTIPRVSCSGAHGYNGEQAIRAAEIVKQETSLELLVNVGFDLNTNILKKLDRLETDTVCCNLETVNESIFNDQKPGETLDNRIRACRMISESGIELSSGLLIGLGESYEDRLNHLNFLSTIKGLGEIPIMGFNPYKGTPMENHPPCSLREQMITIAVTRILFPEIRITVPTPTIGPENVKYSLMAGADNLATVIPENYPLEIKGVGSPACGTLKEVITVIKEMGLKPQHGLRKIHQTKTIPIGRVIQHD
jgi:5,10-methenyltetrahydromethanopterin hydrogenase cofactor biosynthesis protein HmdB